MLHPANSDAGLCTSAVTSNVNVVYYQPNYLLEGRGTPTAIRTASAVPDISTFGGTSLSGILAATVDVVISYCGSPGFNPCRSSYFRSICRCSLFSAGV